MKNHIFHSPYFKSDIYNKIYLSSSKDAIFIARTFNERPNKLMNPSASWWLYNSPVVKEAMLSLYKLYGEVVPFLMMLPL